MNVPVGAAFPRIRNRLLINLGFSIGILLTLVLMFSWHVRDSHWLLHKNLDLREVFVRQLAIWGIWGFFFLGLLYLVARYPLFKRIPFHLLLHLLVSVCFVLLHYYIGYYLWQWAAGNQRLSVSQEGPALIRGIIFVDLLFYWIIAALLSMMHSYRDLKSKTIESLQMQNELLELRLRHLQRQLQPHFLNNSLNGVAGMVRTGRNEEALNMLSKLGVLLRHAAIDETELESTVEQELLLVDLYLELEQTRYGGRLVVTREVPQDCLSLSVPIHSIQELVQNAIKHNIDRQSRLMISLSITKNEGTVMIEVRHSKSDTAGNTTGMGIGLKNLRRRLQLLYGSDSSLSLVAEKAELVARVTYPIHRNTAQ